MEWMGSLSSTSASVSLIHSLVELRKMGFGSEVLFSEFTCLGETSILCSYPE